MPIDIKKLQQFQEIDKQLVSNPAIEIARQISESQMVKEQHLKSLGIGVNWREEYSKHLVGIGEHSYSDLFSAGFRKNIAELMSGFAENSFQDVLRIQTKSIAEAFNVSQSAYITTALDSIRNNLGVVSTQEMFNLRNLGVAANLSFMSEIGMVAKSYSDLFKNDLFAQGIASISTAHSSFLANTLKDFELANSNHIANALKGSITLANEQMLRSIGLIEPSIYEFPKAKIDYLPIFKPNRFRVQRQELIKRVDIEEDETYENLTIKTPSAISFELVSKCMSLIGLCNEASETTKGNTIFTLTSTLWLSAWKLIEVVPTNKDNFAIVVDCLYLMLYEGAGKDKLRFIEQGYISADEAEVIWKIKHLRNKWLRHDIDHGKDSDIKKSHQHRKEALQWFGLSNVPYSKDEFVFLYNNLILKVEEFLNLLLERVSKFTN
jgi:hypothetical protein